MTSDARIERVKNMARRANKRGDEATLRSAIGWLETHWRDDRAAMAFYTELEIVVA